MDNLPLRVFGYYEGQEGLFMLPDNRPWDSLGPEERAANLAEDYPECIYFFGKIISVSNNEL